MNEEIERMEGHWLEQMTELERKLEDAHNRGWKIAELMESIKQRERIIETTETEMVLKAITDGTINGKNEETRKVQKAALLSLERDKEPLYGMYADKMREECELVECQHLRDVDLDSLKVIEYRLHHVNGLLRALAIG